MSSTDYYEVLGISPTSDDVVVHAAYRALMRKHHPDTSQNPDGDSRAKAINEAYSVLRDPELRRRYDSQTRGQDHGHWPPPPPPPASPSGQRSERGEAPVADPQTRNLGTALAVSALVASLVVLGLAVNANLPKDQQTATTASSIAQAEPNSSVDVTPPDRSAADNTQQLEAQVGTIVEPTMGEVADKIALAVEEFIEVRGETGMMGAEVYSRDCFRAARAQAYIIEIDYCVAFDIAAIEFDNAVAGQAGWPLNDYFVSRKSILPSAYNDFENVSPSRFLIVANEASNKLFDSIRSRIDPEAGPSQSPQPTL